MGNMPHRAKYKLHFVMYEILNTEYFSEYRVVQNSDDLFFLIRNYGNTLLLKYFE